MTEFMIKWNLFFLKIFQRDLKHATEIFVYDLALSYIYDIIKLPRLCIPSANGPSLYSSPNENSILLRYAFGLGLALIGKTHIPYFLQ